MVREFDERNLAKSRAVCAAMAEEADTGKRRITERERRILDMWPRYEDGEPVMIGDAVEPPTHGAVSVEAIEFSRGKVCVKDAEDGGWNTSMFAMHPLKRPAPEVLDADGVPIKVGDTVWHKSGIVCGAVEGIDAGSLMHTVRYRSEGGTEYRDAARDLTHTRPDSWKRLFADASDDACAYFGRYDENGSARCVGCPAEHAECCTGTQLDDLIRRVKALAKVEVAE